MRASAAALATAFVVALAGTSTAPASAQAAPAGARSSAASESAATAVAERAPSRRLLIRKIGVNAGIVPVGIRNGQLAVGPSVHSVFRWRHGVVAGQPGSAVLAGHTYSRGAGVFDRLGELRRGDRVNVGRVRFRVTRVRRVTGMSRAEVSGLFSDRGRARLVLITCGDRNNTTGVYRTRIVVNARKV